jgi:hypothetical protein
MSVTEFVHASSTFDAWEVRQERSDRRRGGTLNQQQQQQVVAAAITKRTWCAGTTRSLRPPCVCGYVDIDHSDLRNAARVAPSQLQGPLPLLSLV